MHNRKVIRNMKRQSALQKTFKLKELRVILCDIASYPELIPFQYKKLFKQQLKQIISSCTSTNYNTQLSKQNVHGTDVRNSKFVAKSSLENISVKKNRENHKTITSKLNSKDIKLTKKLLNDNQCDEVLQLKPIKPKWQFLIDSDDDTESFSTTYTYTSNKINHNLKDTVLTNTKDLQHTLKSTISGKSRIDNSKCKLDSTKLDLTHGTSVASAKVGSNGTNYLDKKNLIFIDCNSKIQEFSGEEASIASTKYYRNLTPVDFFNEANHTIKQKCNQNEKNLNIPSIKNEIFAKRNKLEDIRTNKVSKNSYPSDILLTTYNDKVNRKKDEHDTRTKLNNNNNNIMSAVDLKTTDTVSEIIAIDHIAKNNLSETCNKNKSLIIEHTLPKITRDDFLPKGTVKIVRPNKTYSSTPQESISENSSSEKNECNKKNENVKQMTNEDILRKEGNHVSSTETKSINTSKTPKVVLVRTNNIQQNNNTLDNDEFQNKTLNRESSNSLMITTNDIHDNININDCGIKAVTDTNYTIQNRKRTVEKSCIDVNICAKRFRLNRNFQQNNVKSHIKPLNQQFIDSPNTNTKTQDTEYNHTDLREILDRKRIEKTCKLETIDDKTINNTISMEVNNKNSMIGVTNIVENEEICEKLSQKKASTFNKDVCEKQNNTQISSPHSSDLYLSNLYEETLQETHHNQINTNTCKDTNVQKKDVDDVINNNDCNNEEDDDCISLFAETFDISNYEDMFPEKQEKLSKSLQSDIPYIMSTHSFNKYLKQNTNEFNKEYARCMENNIKKSQIVHNSTGNKTENMEVIENSLPRTCNKHDKLLTGEQTLPKITPNVSLSKEMVFNEQLGQTSHTGNLPTSSTNLTFAVQIMEAPAHRLLYHYFTGFCFNILTHSTCKLQSSCAFKHNFQDLINKFHFADSNKIINVIQVAKFRKFYFFCQELYKTSLEKLNTNQILTLYKMFYDLYKLPKDITHYVIKELLRRQIPLKNIVEYISSFVLPINISKNCEILECIKHFMKNGEYWYIARSMVLKFMPDVYIIEKILRDCIDHENLLDAQDINDMLINKLRPGIMSQLNKQLMAHFKSFLTKKAIKDNCTVESVQDFGKSTIEIDTIASPDSKQMELSESYNNTVINRNQTNNIERHGQEINATNSRPYILHPIDNLPEARSVYRDHKNLWKFYVDLKRVKKGLKHQDYDYVIDVLEEYAGKQDNSLFVRACCNMLRTEIERTDHHLANIIQRTVQTGTFAVLRRILFDIGIDILVALMDEDAWRLAFQFVKSLKTCDLPSSAEFIMLSAEIYLANRKTLEALDLLKNKNIIYTSRAKWRVMSTVHDECVRNKLMYILLDSLCNGLIEYAFFLFTFLLRDQSSQFYPIDLSRYVNKLILLLLSRNETSLIIEMGNLILKYNFPLNVKTCRALITTLIHIDEKLTIQLYYYAESIGFYSTIELWPMKYIIINNELTEEEIYLVILRLLEKLKINIGHAIEFVKLSLQFTVYVILQVKSTKQFYCAEQQILYTSQTINNLKALVRNVLKTRFDPPILLQAKVKERICKLQYKSLINYLKSEHCY